MAEMILEYIDCKAGAETPAVLSFPSLCRCQRSVKYHMGQSGAVSLVGILPFLEANTGGRPDLHVLRYSGIKTGRSLPDSVISL